jgi:tRNA pseudouridine32 synthase/23S rRNA pseudouridine746 synthase
MRSTDTETMGPDALARQKNFVRTPTCSVVLPVLSCIFALLSPVGALSRSTSSSSTGYHHSPLHFPAAGPSWEHLAPRRRISTRSVDDWCEGQLLPLQRYRSIRSKSTDDDSLFRPLLEREKPSRSNVGDHGDSFLEQIVKHPSDYNLSKTSVSMVENLESLTPLQRDQLVQKIRVEQQASQPVPLEALEIIYVDASICVVNKPSGVLSVPGPRRNPSLANLVYETLQPPNIALDQMVVHRLDMATSGILIYALSVEALSILHSDFKDRRVQKTYEALVLHENSPVLSSSKMPIAEGEIDVDLERDPYNPPFMRIARPKKDHEDVDDKEETNIQVGKIGSTHKFYTQAPKESLTTWTVLSRESYNGRDVSRLELRPWTGRTHQLRVHCAQALGAPIVGDDIYGDGSTSMEETTQSALCLHARQLCIYHPISGAPMIFEADPPF